MIRAFLRRKNADERPILTEVVAGFSPVSARSIVNEESPRGWVSEAPHWHCVGTGKFDCDGDESIHDALMETGAGEGDVDSPTGWFQAVDLAPDEPDALAHYGSRWLLARQDGNGFFWVMVYRTEESRDVFVTELREQYEAFASEDGEL